jgi:hypothetical protein
MSNFELILIQNRNFICVSFIGLNAENRLKDRFSEELSQSIKAIIPVFVFKRYQVFKKPKNKIKRISAFPNLLAIRLCHGLTVARGLKKT